MKIIAIETSHDDTSVVIYKDKKIIKDFSFSQTESHKKYGGTVPEIASRNHLDCLMEILGEILKCDISNVNHVAYTNEPGLVGSLHMGRLFAKSLSLALGVECKPINHMFGHIYAVAFTEEISYPAIALIASGGHTQIWSVLGINKINLVGETQDDAAGEVYDKVARKLEIGFPGGPPIDKIYDEKLNKNIFRINYINELNFSFSGLKTKVINFINKHKQKNQEIPKRFIATNFQDAVVYELIKKTKIAIKKFKPKSIILGGGVSANSLLRKEFKKIHKKSLIPEMQYTTDNAKMIAIRSAIKEGEKC